MEGDGLEEVRIKKIDILSFSIIFGIFSFFIGIFFGLILLIISILLPSIIFNFDISSYLVLGYYSIIIFPIVFGILGFITGIFGVLIYNLVAKITKGIKIYS